MAKRIRNVAKISATALKDLRETTAHHRKHVPTGGYGFNLTSRGDKIWRGAYLDKYDFERGKQNSWDYHFDYVTGAIQRKKAIRKKKTKGWIKFHWFPTKARAESRMREYQKGFTDNKFKIVKEVNKVRGKPDKSGWSVYIYQK